PHITQDVPFNHKGQGSFQEALHLTNISINSHKKHGGWNERWLRRAKKRVNRTYESEHYLLKGNTRIQRQ
ncbi:hypothetical protein NQ317_015801, partial [Molorchus minor]